MAMAFREVVPVALFHAEPFRWRLATRSLAADAWLQFDDTVDEFLAEKRRVLRDHREDAIAHTDGSEVAAGEVADLVAEALAASDRPVPPPNGSLHPLEWAARAIQEDLCLLEHDGEAWRFTAAAVCFPTRWSPAEKVGLDLRSVHDPVPRYGHIADGVERFFDRLRPGALAWRPNWSLVGENTLRLPAEDRQAPRALADDDITRILRPDAPENLWLRVERQTIRRLVGHRDAAVFTIRIHRWPLHDVLDGVDRALAAELHALPADVAAYKNLEGWRGELAAALATRARSRLATEPDARP